MPQEKDRYRWLVESMPDGFAYSKMVVDGEGKPVDCIFLEANRAFEALTGLKKEDVTGKKATEVMPDIFHSSFDWIGTFGKAALAGERIKFEQYFGPLKCWCEVTAYSNEAGYFAAVFRDITTNKNEKRAMETLSHQAKKFLQVPVGQLDYQMLTDELLELSGAKYVFFNLYDYSNNKSTVMAVSGVNRDFHQTVERFGLKVIGSEWN